MRSIIKDVTVSNCCIKVSLDMMYGRKDNRLINLPILVLVTKMTWQEDSWILLVCMVKSNFSLNDADASHLTACVLRVAFKYPFSYSRILTDTVYTHNSSYTNLSLLPYPDKKNQACPANWMNVSFFYWRYCNLLWKGSYFILHFVSKQIKLPCK